MNERFLALFGAQTFRYRDEVVAFLESASVQTSRSCDVPGSRGNLPCLHYQRIYETRAKSLPRRRSGEPYWDELRAAVDAICSAFVDTPDDPCCLWTITNGTELEFLAFENTALSRIMGCLRFRHSKHSTARRRLTEKGLRLPDSTVCEPLQDKNRRSDD
jgi:hypothetical protein